MADNSSPRATMEKRAVIGRGKAGRACEFCRRRKLKCDGEKPQCGSCNIHARPCVYTSPAKQARPTRAAIIALHLENQILRSRSSVTADAMPASYVGEVSPRGGEKSARRSEHEEVIEQTYTRSTTPRSHSTRIPASLSGTSTYHGPTSTLFDEESHVKRAGNLFSAEREALMPRLLFAEAAKQRQLEGVNAGQNLLDFDGVDPEMGLHLLNLHWNRQHHSFLVTYRPAFMRDMACSGPYFSKLLLNAIYYGSAKFSPRLELRKDPADVRTAGWQFRKRVRDLLGEAMDSSKITTIQALLQMTNSLFALGDEQSAAWIYAGTAFRMIYDLGLHVDATQLPNVKTLTEEDLEIRRRVFWSAFVIDKVQSLYQGRAATLQATQCDVPIAFKDDYEEMEHWVPFAYTNTSAYAGTCSYSVSTFTQLCHLCVILNRVLNKIYSENSGVSNPPRVQEDLISLENELKQWMNDIPQHLRLRLDAPLDKARIPPPHILSLIAMYNVLSILLHRPFIASGHLHSASPLLAVQSLKKCAAAASAIVAVVRFYDQAFGVTRAPYLISYATYVAATIHVRIAARTGANSEAHDCLRTCLSVFDQNAETNHAVRKAKHIIEHLAERMNVNIQPTRPDERHPDTMSPSQAAVHSVQRETSNSLPSAHSINLMQVAEWDPDVVTGNTALSLDMDAIIRSFVQQEPPNDLHQLDPSWANHTYDPQFSTWEHTFDSQLPLEDMIFGFNTSDLNAQYR